MIAEHAPSLTGRSVTLPPVRNDDLTEFWISCEVPLEKTKRCKLCVLK